MNDMTMPRPSLHDDFYRAAQTHDAKDIGQYMIIERTALCPADFIFVFGNAFSPLLSVFAAEAARLYHEGYSHLIVVSGGVVPKGEIFNEARILNDLLLQHDVPQNAILREEQATNTQQNIEFTRAQYGGDPRLIHAEKAISVAHALNGRRYLMTAKQHWPEVLFMASNCWVPPFGRDSWMTHPRYRKEGFAQFERFGPYVEQKFIAEIDIEQINRAVLKGPVHA